MEVLFAPEQQARLIQMAQAQGCPTEFLVKEAVDRLLSYDLAAADRGDVVDHQEVRRMIDARFSASR